jgi:hypothetical protein
MTEDVQALSIRFPGALYERLRKAAYERHEPMNTIVVRATERELDSPSQETRDEDRP